MGAKAIGIDIVFDSPRPDDDLLKDQLRAMRTPTWLAYAEQSSNPDAIFFEQQTFLQSFLKEVTTDRTKPTSRSEEHTSELQSLMRISYSVFCLKKKKKTNKTQNTKPKYNK